MIARAPHFYVVGAPRCGTTAICSYLASHPRICFSRPKEPHYFSDDFPGLGFGGGIDRYKERCFSHCRTGESVLGEGSTWYIYSRVAARRIMSEAPDARFVVMLRNPLELLPSLHAQLLRSYDESERDLRRAWELQEQRAAGRALPPGCREPAMLQYRELIRLGGHLERLLEAVPAGRVLPLLLDDLARDSRATYLEVLGFLGLEDDGRSDFARLNPRRRHRSRLVGRLVKRPPRSLERAVRRAKRALGVESFGLRPLLEELNSAPVDRRRLPEGLPARVAAEVADDVALLGRLLDRDLSGWLEHPVQETER